MFFTPHQIAQAQREKDWNQRSAASANFFNFFFYIDNLLNIGNRIGGCCFLVFISFLFYIMVAGLYLIQKP